jgi:hypothetical protein
MLSCNERQSKSRRTRFSLVLQVFDDPPAYACTPYSYALLHLVKMSRQVSGSIASQSHTTTSSVDILNCRVSSKTPRRVLLAVRPPTCVGQQCQWQDNTSFVSVFHDKACVKARTTYKPLFQRIHDRFTNETRSSCSACLMRPILHTATVVNQIISNLWRGLDQPTSAIRPRVLGKPQKASDSPIAICNTWAYVQEFFTRRKESMVAAANMHTSGNIDGNARVFPEPQRCPAY